MKNTIPQHQHIHTSTSVNMSKHMNVFVKLKKEKNKFCETRKGFAEDHLELSSNPRADKPLCVTAYRDTVALTEC